MATSIAKRLFDSAAAYYRGATILMEPSSLSDSHLLIQPGLTCAALSLKLYLKCILALEGDDENTVYGIVDLYKKISDPVKKNILEKFDEFSNTQLTSPDLVRHLEGLDNAFVRWRYIHEEDAKSVNVEDLEQMILAAKAAVVSINPEWE